MIFLRKLHKWLGLVIGLQVLVWVVTGATISLLDAQTVGGRLTRAAPVAKPMLTRYTGIVPLSQLPVSITAATGVHLSSFFDRPVYRVDENGGRTLFDAQSGQKLIIDRALAEQIGRSSYAGEGAYAGMSRLDGGSEELRAVPGALWRLDFTDEVATRVYVSAQDGRVLAHRNDRWALVDFLLMLHFMDYFRTDSFNNPQIIVVAFATLWIAISGLLLVFYSFSRNDFRWVPGIANSGKSVNMRVGVAGDIKEQVALDRALSVYASLGRKGINLPSNCEGSGSCGLCKVLYEDSAPDATAVDKQWISATGLALGERLACQHKPASGDSIVVPDIAYQYDLRWGVCVSRRWLTPLLKEIRIRPDERVDFQPGEYFQFRVPICSIDREQLDVPAQFRPLWDSMSLPEQWHSVREQFRAYSVASAPGQEENLAFTVRFSPPPVDTDHAPGIGSGYLCSLRPGDRLAFRGPTGDFQLHESDREKILIGGGAGMAPLRSMALHLLQNKAWKGRLRFWYGARNQREILYREMFESLAEQHSNFEWGVALSDPADDQSWQGERGFIHQVVLDRVLSGHANLFDCEFYLCGPPLMLAATCQMLGELGVPEDLIRFDDFGS